MVALGVHEDSLAMFNLERESLKPDQIIPLSHGTADLSAATLGVSERHTIIAVNWTEQSSRVFVVQGGVQDPTAIDPDCVAQRGLQSAVVSRDGSHVVGIVGGEARSWLIRSDDETGVPACELVKTASNAARVLHVANVKRRWIEEEPTGQSTLVSIEAGRETRLPLGPRILPDMLAVDPELRFGLAPIEDGVLVAELEQLPSALERLPAVSSFASVDRALNGLGETENPSGLSVRAQIGADSLAPDARLWLRALPPAWLDAQEQPKGAALSRFLQEFFALDSNWPVVHESTRDGSVVRATTLIAQSPGQHCTDDLRLVQLRQHAERIWYFELQLTLGLDFTRALEIASNTGLLGSETERRFFKARWAALEATARSCW